MTSGSLDAAWRMNDVCGNHWPSAHRLWERRTLRKASLVVIAKHGLGDAVQMLRYAERLRDLSSSVKFEVPSKLDARLPFFRGMGDGSTNNLSSFEPLRLGIEEIEMMELPYLFRTRLEDLPLTTGYLAIPNTISRHYLSYRGSTDKARIGIVWRGGEWDRERWIPFNILSPLITNDTYEWWIFRVTRWAKVTALR